MARKYRKRRRRMRMKRKGRRQRFRGRGNATEVKYRSLVNENQAGKLAIANAASETLYAEQCYISNIFENISTGTGYFNRVGNKIYVTSILVRTFHWSCPSATTYDAGTHIVRHIWHNQRSAAGVAVQNFFIPGGTVNFTLPIARKAVTVHHDKYYRVQAFESTTENTGTYTAVGATRVIQYTIPVNRYVTFTEGGFVKEDYNVYSFACLTGSPGMGATANNQRQIGCFNYYVRVYFKDA